LAADAVRSGALVIAAAFGIAVALMLVFPFMQADWSLPVIYGFVAALARRRRCGMERRLRG
jgi:hypothetical protein